jgi:hypothetical protein
MSASGANCTESADKERQVHEPLNHVASFDHELYGGSVAAQNHVLAPDGVDKDVLKTGQVRQKYADL